MEEVYNEEDFFNHLTSIMPPGFTLNEDAFMTKSETDRIIRISLSYQEYYPDSINIGGLVLGVTFVQVEQIFQTIAQSSDMYIHQTINPTTFKKSFTHSILTREEVFEKIYDVDIYNDESFYQVQPYLIQMRDAALDFVNQHQTLQDFYNYGETMPIEEQANFYAQPLPQRKMIIKKLLSLPDYNSYTDDLIDFYTNEEPDPQEVAFIQALKTHLDNM